MTVKLFCGDCLEIMPTLDKVDAVVTDPPYGIGVTICNNNSERWSAPPAIQAQKQEWDENIVVDVIPLILKCSDNIIIWGGNYYAHLLPPKSCWLVWDKMSSGVFADCELAWTTKNTAIRLFQYLWNGFRKQQPEARFHPTQKPLALMEWCLSFLPDAVTILDPFMGSGTTGVACVNTGRNFIGIEKDPQYFEIAKERIAEAERRKNNEFFVKKPTAPTLFDFMLEGKP